jgi:hypothetical protein
MKIIETIEVESALGKNRIELLLGDLTNIPASHTVDVLIISAFPHDYQPIDTSLIGALFRSGLSVEDLARRPQADLRKNFSCWLSQRLQRPIAGLSFHYVLCFEPAFRGMAPEVVGDIFRALAPFTFGEPNIRSVAMPILAAGDQGYSISTMLRPLLTAATNWLAIGFPVNTIKLVVRDNSKLEEALSVFKSFKLRSDRSSTEAVKRKQTQPPLSNNLQTIDPYYEVFLSYSRQDEDTAQHFTHELRRQKVSVFLDRSEIEIGAAWQQTIFDALERCSVTAALYSPGFVNSKVCKDEFNISWARGREAEQNLIFPLLIRDTALPTYMKMLNYIDCRICDKTKIADAAQVLARRLRSDKRPIS